MTDNGFAGKNLLIENLKCGNLSGKLSVFYKVRFIVYMSALLYEQLKRSYTDTNLCHLCDTTFISMVSQEFFCSFLGPIAIIMTVYLKGWQFDESWVSLLLSHWLLGVTFHCYVKKVYTAHKDLTLIAFFHHHLSIFTSETGSNLVLLLMANLPIILFTFCALFVQPAINATKHISCTTHK